MRLVACARDNRTRRCLILAFGLALAGASTVAVAPEPARAEETFTPGVGIAEAHIVKPNIASGQLSVAVIGGQAAATYRDRSASGTSTLFALPFLQLASGSRVCGTTGTDYTDSLPQPVVANTAANGDTEPVSAADEESAPVVGDSLPPRLPTSRPAPAGSSSLPASSPWTRR